MKSVTVFCGSSEGVDNIYMSQASLLGNTLAKKNMTVVYGGAKYGLMGAVANGALSVGGKVIGVLPHFLMNREAAHGQLTELILVDSMHERKQEMFELCEGFIIIPGGLGTLEELFEIWTWSQLGLHRKPIALLNINGFYDALLELIQSMVNNGFVKETSQSMLIVDTSIDGLIQKMQEYKGAALNSNISSDNM